MKKSDRYFKHGKNGNYVVKVGAESKKGFVPVLRGSARGVDRIGEHILEEQYEECSYNHFKNHVGSEHGRA